MKGSSSFSQSNALQQLVEASCLSVANISHVLAARSEPSISSSKFAPSVTSTRTSSCVTTRSRTTQHPLTERQLFLVFVKILFQYMEHTKLVALRRRARIVVQECTARNRCHEAAYMPLQPMVAQRLQDTLGHRHWARVQECFDVYCLQQGICCRATAEASPAARVAV
jgi:hypothetical protein